ncbi:MAG: hypothetical protein Tsb0014_28400 [Pleurocapsa sp.]
MALSNLESEVKTTATNQFIEEISIIIAAQDLTPTMMSQDFLRFSGIVAQDWELSQQPILNPNYAQLNFKNGISITAQPRTITVSESLSNKNLNDIQAPQVVAKYIEKLPHAEYLGLSCSPKILVPFPDAPDRVRQYITGTLLGAGEWKEIGNAPVQAGVNLMYSLDRCQLTMSISEARLQQPQQAPIFALLFSGSFNYNIDRGDISEAKVARLNKILNYWHTDLQTFRELINEKFLNSSSSKNLNQSSFEESVFPGQML